MDDRKGTLAPGMLADLAMLSLGDERFRDATTGLILMREIVRRRTGAGQLTSRHLVHIVEDNDAVPLGDFEQLVLLALFRLGPDAYGATVRREIETRAGRQLSISAVYTTLERLEKKGFVRSWIGEPTPQRGGRRRKHFELLPPGARALRDAYQAFAGMAAGVERRLKALG